MLFRVRGDATGGSAESDGTRIAVAIECARVRVTTVTTRCEQLMPNMNRQNLPNKSPRDFCQKSF